MFALADITDERSQGPTRPRCDKATEGTDGSFYAVLRGRRPPASDEAAKRRVILIDRQGKWRGANFDPPGFGHNSVDHVGDFPRRGLHTAKIEDMGTLDLRIGTGDEGIGHFVDMLHHHRGIVIDAERLAQDSSQHGPGGCRGQPLIASGTVDRVGPHADAGNLPVLPVDPCDTLVGELVDTIERIGTLPVRRRQRCDRTGINHVADPSLPCGFENVGMTHHVDRGTGHRIGRAKRYQKCGEVRMIALAL